MTRLEVTGEVARAFGGLQITAVVVSGFDGRRPWPEVDAQLTAADQAVGALAPGPGDLTPA